MTLDLEITIDLELCGRCVTLMADESYAYNSSYRRIGGLVEGSLAADGAAGGAHYSAASGERQGREAESAISAPRGCDQRGC